MVMLQFKYAIPWQSETGKGRDNMLKCKSNLITVAECCLERSKNLLYLVLCAMKFNGTVCMGYNFHIKHIVITFVFSYL